MAKSGAIVGLVQRCSCDRDDGGVRMILCGYYKIRDLGESCEWIGVIGSEIFIKEMVK